MAKNAKSNVKIEGDGNKVIVGDNNIVYLMKEHSRCDIMINLGDLKIELYY